jgi:Threonine aldolase
MKKLDFRSDTTTQQTPEMRSAMAYAVVGDDVYGDDPSINELENYAAYLLGKEAALFVSSGVMGNQLAIMAHTERGQEVLTHHGSHIFQHEQASSSLLAQVKINPIVCPNDHLTAELIRENIHDNDIHYATTALIEYENALSNGTVYTLTEMNAIQQVAKELNIPVHLDGARLFNAATYLDVSVKDMAQCADSIMFCLSKGLAAPVGSMLVGTKEFIAKARYYRKLIGGGMRQAGFLAAAGMVALKGMRPQLKIDHENAQYLAEQLEKTGIFKVDFECCQINLVFFEIIAPEFNADKWTTFCESQRIKVGAPYKNIGRFVTHYGIEKLDIDRLVATIYDYDK